MTDIGTRDRLKLTFLEQHGWHQATRTALQADASFRHYERLAQDGETRILMDAPPTHEDVRPFMQVAAYLEKHQLTSPKIYAADEENGFLLLEDFGSDSYTKILAKAPADPACSERELYEKALDVLIALHQLPLPDNLPDYSEDMLLREAALMIEWYFPALNGEPLSSALQEEYMQVWKQLLPFAKVLNPVVVLRDYHADNLMWLPDRNAHQKVGLLDFQDAVLGSPAYDIVSLLEDARRDVGIETVQAMITRYLTAMPHITRKDFLASYAILGAQRNCKIIGIFTRKSARDHNSSYLKFLPRVFGHIQNDMSHPLLAPLRTWMDKVISPHLRAPRQPSISYNGAMANA